MNYIAKTGRGALVAFAAGAVAGAVAALLFAPASGGETRGRIASAMNRARQDRVRATSAQVEANEALEQAMHQAMHGVG
jgi:gas vesicle protein